MSDRESAAGAPSAAVSPSSDAPLRMVVAIPSTNRSAILPATVRDIALQTRLPDLMILSLASPEDIGDLDAAALPFPLRVVYGPRGATNQRNRVMDELTHNDIVLMLDDDFLMAPDYIAQTLALFEQEPNVVLGTGTLLADGIHGHGYDHETGQKILAEGLKTPARDEIRSAYSAYGCNFSFRVETALDHGIRFDEALPFYSWLEDVDFSRRIAAHGQLVKSGLMRGVHMGTKTGRTPGIYFGYSQIANPVYLKRKGSMKLWHAVMMMSRNVLSNLLHSVRPPTWADYRGRLRGNLLALWDLIRGRSSPMRVVDLKS